MNIKKNRTVDKWTDYEIFQQLVYHSVSSAIFLRDFQYRTDYIDYVQTLNIKTVLKYVKCIKMSEFMTASLDVLRRVYFFSKIFCSILSSAKRNRQLLQ